MCIRDSVHDAGGVRVLENGRRRARIHTVVPGRFAPPDAVGFAAEFRDISHAIDALSLIHIWAGFNAYQVIVVPLEAVDHFRQGAGFVLDADCLLYTSFS